MARVTVDHGAVVACVWDHDSGGGPLSLFWEAAHGLDGAVQDESQARGCFLQGHLGELFRDSGLKEVEVPSSPCLSSTRASMTGGSPTPSA